MLCTPLYPMVLLIIIPMKNCYFIGGINPTFSDKPISNFRSCEMIVPHPLRSRLQPREPESHTGRQMPLWTSPHRVVQRSSQLGPMEKWILKERVFDGFWWFLMVFDGFWWFLMVFDGFWWFLMVFDGFWWFLMVFDGFWWFLMVFDGFWWFLMVFDGFWWFLMVFDGCWHFAVADLVMIGITEKPWTLQCCARPDPAECSASAQSAPCRGAPYAVRYAGCSTCKWPWRCLNPMFMMFKWQSFCWNADWNHLHHSAAVFLPWLGHLRTCFFSRVDRCPPGNRKILWEKMGLPKNYKNNQISIFSWKNKNVFSIHVHDGKCPLPSLFTRSQLMFQTQTWPNMTREKIAHQTGACWYCCGDAGCCPAALQQMIRETQKCLVHTGWSSYFPWWKWPQLRVVLGPWLRRTRPEVSQVVFGVYENLWKYP